MARRSHPPHRRASGRLRSFGPPVFIGGSYALRTQEGRQEGQVSLSDLPAALEWLSRSPIHRNWTVDDIQRLIIPPLQFEQYIIRPYGLATWGFLSSQAALGYVHGRRPLQPADFYSGDQLWVIDLIGNARRLAHDLRDAFPDVERAYFRRTYGTGQTVRIGNVGRRRQRRGRSG